MPSSPRRWLLRFGYDGAGFAGWARQPGLRTVEGTIRESLRRTGIATTAEAAGIQVASRTDKGVSARANALVLSSALPPAALVRTANGIAPDIRFLSAAEVDEAFRVRDAEWREYHYFEAIERSTLGSYRATARRFVGRPIDVRSLGRGIPPAEPSWRTVDSVVIREIPGGARIEVRAASFVWGMVRKMVAALREVQGGRLALTDLERSLRGEHRLSLPLAEPQNLLLWEVHHAVAPQVEARSFSRRQAEHLARARTSAWARAGLLREFADPGPVGG
jgi:tRNA pseudouridine38-40 synthase